MSSALVVVSTLFIPSMGYAQPKAPPAQEILVFPLTNNAGDSYSKLTSRIAGDIRLKINALGYYRSTGFSRLNPSIIRAENSDENTLTDSDVATPTATPDLAQKIAGIVGTDDYLVANVDSITEDTTTNTDTVVLDGTLYSADSGAVIQQATSVTGIAAPASKSFDPDQILATAVDSATGKLVAQLCGPQYEKLSNANRIAPAKNGATNFGVGILLVLAVALTLVLIHNHSHSSGSSSSSGSSTTTTSTTGGTTGVISTTGGTTGLPPSPPI